MCDYNNYYVEAVPISHQVINIQETYNKKDNTKRNKILINISINTMIITLYTLLFIHINKKDEYNEKSNLAQYNHIPCTIYISLITILIIFNISNKKYIIYYEINILQIISFIIIIIIFIVLYKNHNKYEYKKYNKEMIKECSNVIFNNNIIYDCNLINFPCLIKLKENINLYKNSLYNC